MELFECILRWIYAWEISGLSLQRGNCFKGFRVRQRSNAGVATPRRGLALKLRLRKQYAEFISPSIIRDYEIYKDLISNEAIVSNESKP